MNGIVIKRRVWMKIIIKFAGGPWDGRTLAGMLGDQDEVGRYYLLSNHGRLGQRFRVASQYAVDTLAEEELKEERPHNFQQHSYEVIDHIQNEETTLVRVRYVSPTEGPMTDSP
jgi:hypothetical protein